LKQENTFTSFHFHKFSTLKVKVKRKKVSFVYI